jgi:hypothetical protein
MCAVKNTDKSQLLLPMEQIAAIHISKELM